MATLIAALSLPLLGTASLNRYLVGRFLPGSQGLLYLSLFAYLVFACCLSVGTAFTTPAQSLIEALVDFLVLVALHDVYFYVCHRAMHHPFLYRRVHFLHHRIRHPHVWSAMAVHPVEAIVEALYLPLAAWLIGPSAAPLIAFFFFMHATNILGHAGIDLLPALRLSWLNSEPGHRLHHRRANSNFGAYTNCLDRLGGTYTRPKPYHLKEYVAEAEAEAEVEAEAEAESVSV